MVKDSSDSDGESPKKAPKSNKFNHLLLQAASLAGKKQLLHKALQGVDNNVTGILKNRTHSVKKEDSSDSDSSDEIEKRVSFKPLTQFKSEDSSSDSESESNSKKNVGKAEESSDSENEKKEMIKKVLTNYRNPGVQTIQKKVEDLNKSSFAIPNNNRKMETVSSTESESEEDDKTVKNATQIVQNGNVSDSVDSENDSSDSEYVKKNNKTKQDKKKKTKKKHSSSSDSSSDEESREEFLQQVTDKVKQIRILQDVKIAPKRVETSLEDKVKEQYPRVKPVQVDGVLSDLSESDEIFVLHAPKDVRLSLDQIIEFNPNKKFKIDHVKYVLEPINTSEKVLLANKPKTVKATASFRLEKYSKTKNRTNVFVPEQESVQIPDDLKTRHALFGTEYLRKVDLEDVVDQKLQEALLNVRKQKPPKKKKKKKPAEEELKDEVIFNLLNSHSSKKKTDSVAEIPKKAEKTHYSLLQNISREKPEKRKMKSAEEASTFILSNSFTSKTKNSESSEAETPKKSAKTKDGLINQLLSESLSQSISEGKPEKRKKKSAEEGSTFILSNSFTSKTTNSESSEADTPKNYKKTKDGLINQLLNESLSQSISEEKPKKRKKKSAEETFKTTNSESSEAETPKKSEKTKDGLIGQLLSESLSQRLPEKKKKNKSLDKSVNSIFETPKKKNKSLDKSTSEKRKKKNKDVLNESVDNNHVGSAVQKRLSLINSTLISDNIKPDFNAEMSRINSETPQVSKKKKNKSKDTIKEEDSSHLMLDILSTIKNEIGDTKKRKNSAIEHVSKRHKKNEHSK